MTRERLNLNREWKFLRGDDDRAASLSTADTFATPMFDDAGWQSVSLPHCFDVPYFRTPEFYVGYGWYRKTFTLPPSPCTQGEGRGEGAFSLSEKKERTLSPALSLGTGRGRRLFLEFDGVFQVAEVFVNGQPAGGHKGGYTGFCLDITNLVHPGENLLAVRVNNNWNARLSPRAGEHIFSGGIYRDVHLLVTDPLHITWNGVSVTTPHVSNESGTVQAKIELRNDSQVRRTCTIQSAIFDQAGVLITTMRSSQAIEPLTTAEFIQTCEIAPPRLWHPDHPYLYRVRTRIYDGDELVDEISSPLGFRWFEWTADRGFFLNGKHFYLRGANAHQDHSGWGIAVTQAGIERDVRLVKEAGFNFLRGAHYPHHPAFADACDRLGMLFWSESTFWGKGGFGPEGYWNASAYPVNAEDFEPFENHCKQTLAEMIRINRKHPSIIAWSMTNEAFFTYNLDRAKSLMTDMVKLSRKLDPARPAAIGGSQRGDVDHLGDIAGYNGDGARLFLDPGVPNMVSEYGAISKPPGAYEPFFGDLQSEKFAWRSGEAIWCAFDYGSIAGRQGLKGIITHSRLPKQSWHWYRDHYCVAEGVGGQGSGGREQDNLTASPCTQGEGRGEGAFPLSTQHPALSTPKNPLPTPLPEYRERELSAEPPTHLHLATDKRAIYGTHAIDDCQLIVTVCDAIGKRVNHSPPVTLTIESGPGEFPTGRSITFDTATDIDITLGQAAIEFRSYHGGESLIRATSPGLTDATISIVTHGEPRFTSDIAPAIERPYIPPKLSEAATVAMKNIVNVALNRPSRASSEDPAHPARFANDGDPSTMWSTVTLSPSHPVTPSSQSWQVDLEGFYQISGVKLRFPSPLNWRYTVEFSTDGSTWDLAIDRTQTTRSDETRNDITPPGALARYVRVTFASLPPDTVAALVEVEVFGVLSVR